METTEQLSTDLVTVPFPRTLELSVYESFLYLSIKALLSAQKPKPGFSVEGLNLRQNCAASERWDGQKQRPLWGVEHEARRGKSKGDRKEREEQ